MDIGCLCKDCFEILVQDVVNMNDDVKLMTDKASIAHNSPLVEVPYENEKGNRYWRSVEADINFCCQCGTGI